MWAAGNRSAARAEYEKAIDAANESLKINAADPRTRALIAICEAKLGHAEAARRLIREALAAAPNDSDLVYKQALIETVNGDLEQGLAALQRALQLGYSATMLGADRDLDPLRKKPGFPVSH